jgi:GNAT superfamily N-acetyltransferase
MTVTVSALRGFQIAPAIDALAGLRIAVFSEWPYLYDGDLAYERDYLAEFAAAPDAVLVTATDGDRIVGAATASPMWAQKAEFRAPFEDRGIDTETLFYFGESVLLPQYRGLGLGHAFFDHRESRARECGAAAATFASVVRKADDPRRPDGYIPLDGFWCKRGYAPIEGLLTELAWKEHGEDGESLKQLRYWIRRFG